METTLQDIITFSKVVEEKFSTQQNKFDQSYVKFTKKFIMINDQHQTIFSFYTEVLQQFLSQDQLTPQFMIYCMEEYFFGEEKYRLKSDYYKKTLITKDEVTRQVQSNSSDEKEIAMSTIVICGSKDKNEFLQILAKMIDENDFNLSKTLIVEYYILAGSYLEKVYQDYFKKTKSYQVIEKKIEDEEVLQLRLYQLGMTYFSMPVLQSISADYNTRQSEIFK